MRAALLIFLSACLVGTVCGPAAAELQITIDTNGSGFVTLADTDADGVVDFDTTVGAVLEARGQVKEIEERVNWKVAIAPLPPFADALFRNVSGVQQSITVTVRSGTAPTLVEPPLGWDIFYNANVDDPVDSIVDVPAHSVQAFAGGGTIFLGVVNGPPLLVASAIVLEEHGVDPVNTTTDAWIVWNFTLGPNDEFRVPTDGGFDGESIQVNVFNQPRKCTDKMNNGARKIIIVAQKTDVRCIRASTGSVTACVDADDDAKTVKNQIKLVSNFEAQCDPVPAWGVNALSCCFGGGTNDGNVCADSSTCGGGQCAPGGCIAEVAESSANDMTHDLFGPGVTVSADANTRRCQYAVSRSAGRVLEEHWRAFRLCKRDEFLQISNDAELVAACLQPEPDPRETIARREARLAAVVQKKCLDKGVSNLGVELPGACSAASDPAFAECLARRARCRFCLGANVADAIAPAMDCDVFDDDLANGSCTP